MALGFPSPIGRIHGEVARQKEIREKYGPAILRSLLSLSKEKDDRIYCRELLNLSLRLQREGKGELAIPFLQQLHSQKKVPEVSERAGKILAALEGRGPFGLRAEMQLSQFIDQVTDGPALLGMVVGGAAYRLTRTTILSRLIGPVTSRTLFGTLGARTAASTAALLVEAPLFTTTTKLANSALGREVDWSSKRWGHEMASAAIMLGSLRLFGYGAGQLGRGFQKAGWFGSRSPAILSTLGMYTGILSSQHLEVYTGLRDPATLHHGWFEALVTLAHFKVAGSLLQRFTPIRYQRWEQNLDRRSEFLLNRAENRFEISPWRNLALETPMGGEIVLAKVFGEEPASQSPLSPRTRGRASPLSEHSKIALGRIKDSLGKEVPFAEMLGETRIPDDQQFEISLMRVSEALYDSRNFSARGSYVDWITRQLLERILFRRNPQTLEELLKRVYREDSLAGYEEFVATEFPDAKLLPRPKLLDPIKRWRNPHYEEIQNIPLGEKGHEILWRWILTQKKISRLSPLYTPEDILLRKLRYEVYNRERIEMVNRVLELAAGSPVALLRIKRLYLVLDGPKDLMLPKLGELADPNFRLHGEKPASLPASPEELRNSQWDAYLGNNSPVDLIHEIHKVWPTLSDPAVAKQNAQRRDQVLGRLAHERRETGSPNREDVVEAFRRLGDPLSQKIAEAISNNDFEIHLLEWREFQRRVEQATGKKVNRTFQAHYAAPGVLGEKGVMLVRKRPAGLPLSTTPAESFFEVLSHTVHEFRHVRDMRDSHSQKQTDIYWLESGAYGQEFLWRAIHGDNYFLRELQIAGNAGIAMKLRNRIEAMASERNN